MSVPSDSFCLRLVIAANGNFFFLVLRTRAFSPLPFAEDGVAVEPRPVEQASTSIWFEPPPRRSLKQERELRQLAALSALARQTQRARVSPRQARAARQLHQVILLAAALRRAGFPR